MVEDRQGGPQPGLGGIWQRWRRSTLEARARQEAAHALYAGLVGLARDPAYYLDGGVPDTNDGRLEMVGLHVALAMRRLAREGQPGRDLARALMELMVDDVDRSLRELGVSDLAVGKKVKGIAASFRGRAAALEAALAADDREALATMLLRNLYLSGQVPTERQVLAVADRLLELDRAFARADAASMLAGRLGEPAGSGTGR